MAYKRSVYWFTHDQRLEFNSLFNDIIQKSEEVAFIFVVNERWLQERNYQHQVLGSNRRSFLVDSLEELALQLTKYGYRLTVLWGDPVKQVKRFITKYNIDTLVGCSQFGYFEQRQWQSLANSLPEVKIINRYLSTLFDPYQVPTNLKTFSQFRTQVENNETVNTFRQVNDLFPYAHQIPIESDDLAASDHHLLKLTPKVDLLSQCHAQRFFAGEKSAQYHLSSYFSGTAPKQYKQTRNELDGWTNSTKFSPYLANGNLSPRQIWSAVTHYEHEFGENESTYWIKFELLWREYFQWLCRQQGASLFNFQGLAKSAPTTTFLPERFKAWCCGQTPYPIVNACMKQLNATGFMSNRGRQIVASCLVNELAVDWRYGAAYFQQQLIDHDVASNWGNWQYIAGVGVDPRGGRHFNLSKQSERYDPNNQFIEQWGGEKNTLILDSQDATGWPCTDPL